MEKIIKANSEGFNYNYASLSDIAKQGYEIPKMTTRLIEGNEYVFYLDNGEWQQGARVVIPQQRGMNEAQQYGSALTYARRYTTLMALQLVSDDDKELEDSKATEKQIEYFKKLYKPDEIELILKHYGVNDVSELSKSVVSQYLENKSRK